MKAKLLIPFMLLLAACTTGNKPMTETQKEAVKQEGSVVVKEVFNAMAVNDIQKLISLCDTSADYIFINYGDIYDYKQVIDMVNNVFPNVEKQTFDTKFEKYVVISPTCFMYFWKGRNGIYMKSGESNVVDEYIVSYTFVKEGRTWKFLNGHESFKVPLPSDSATVASTK
jgi:hypothetical protein